MLGVLGVLGAGCVGCVRVCGWVLGRVLLLSSGYASMQEPTSGEHSPFELGSVHLLGIVQVQTKATT